MNRTEINEFKNFLLVRELFGTFSQYYRTNHLTSNPPTLEAYLEKAKAESVIPQAFLYQKTIYGKDFWLAIHEEWMEQREDVIAGRIKVDEMLSAADIRKEYEKEHGSIYINF